MKALVIAAHPDDEVLGCGGTIARRVQEGWHIDLLFLSSGVGSRSSKNGRADVVERRDRLKSAEQAAEVLGADKLTILDHPDNRFDSIDLLDLIKEIDSVGRQQRPEVIFTHHTGDLNIDHAITARAVLTAFRPLPGCFVRKIYAFEIPSSTEWFFGSGPTIFRPNTFVDITDQFDRKIEALKCYGSELRNFPHPRSIEGVESIAKKWGSTVGCERVEAFELIWSVK